MIQPKYDAWTRFVEYNRGMESVKIADALIKELYAENQALKAAVGKMRLLADEARGHITSRPANKPRANMCLLKIQQMSIFPEEEAAEIQKVGEEFVKNLVAEAALQSKEE